MALLELKTGIRHKVFLGLIFKYGIKIERSLSPTNSDTNIKTKC
ncbi:integrase [Listeria innocua FSL J1-023]|nr:integrase [Listeria innocua FSL J1-023]